MPSAQCFAQRPAVVAGDVVAGAAGVGRAHLEAGGVDEAVELVLRALDHHAVLGDAVDALAVGVDQVTLGRL